jgi:putative SOS response-associated peptidase YedK
VLQHASAAGGVKQPYAIVVKDGSPFIAGIWENRKDPASGE